MTEKIQQMLQELEKGGVKFLPWIGENYEDGIYFDEKGKLHFDEKGELRPDNGKRKKVLVLGESFYWDDDDDGNGKMFIYNLIQDFIDPKYDFRPYERTFIKFERAMAGRELDKKERIKFWNHVAFYNYVQEPILRTRMAPTQEQYDNSVDAFLSLIKICQPQAVIAWGLRLYNNLPNPKQIKGEMGRYINTDADDSYETWNYYLEDKIIPVIGIYHPSSAFDWMYWNQIITKFLNHE